MLVANIGMLTAAGTLTQPRATEQIALDWPLAARDGFTDPGYHAITGFVDHTPDIPNKLTDYACGGRTYSGHKGTDIFMWPFAWNKMAAGDVTIAAAADGVIVGRRDGNPDQSCNFNSNSWNAVYVRHADGSIAWYGHMKRGSLTTRGVGSMVSAGEYLGLVGSSGNSTGPHLHFELHDYQGQLLDPYIGSCNPLEGGSWWASQPNYYDSAINKLMTGTGPVSWKACPLPDDTNEAINSSLATASPSRPTTATSSTPCRASTASAARTARSSPNGRKPSNQPITPCRNGGGHTIFPPA